MLVTAETDVLPRPIVRFSLSVLSAFLLSSLSVPCFAGVKAIEVHGKVQSRTSETLLWTKLKPDQAVAEGEEIKTGWGGKITLSFDDGSKVAVGPRSSFVVESAKKAHASLRLSLGKMRAWVSKVLSRRFSVRTPTAVCSVRGTEFEVNVAENGQTSVELFRGLLGVADNRGNETLLHEGERVDVGTQGLGQTGDAGTSEEASDEKERARLKREVGLEMTKEEVQAAAALERKNAVYEQGKAMIDVNGHRVRLEEYIIRPADNEFKFVVLNERADRFDYFYYKGTFNATLPEDLSQALRQVPGCVGTACTWWLTGYETGRSNTTDSMLETAAGGHLVDVNNNGVDGDEVAFAFDSSVNDFVSLNVTAGTDGGQSYFKALYDTYDLLFDGVSHHSWTSAVGAYTPGGCAGGVGPACGGIQSMANDRSVTNVTNLIEPPNCDDLDRCTGFREDGKFHDIQYLQDAGGNVWEKFDNYIIDDDGQIASFSDFAGITSGADYKTTLLKWNYQQIITASEFQGRKIDLVFEPKILIQSGLIP